MNKDQATATSRTVFSTRQSKRGDTAVKQAIENDQYLRTMIEHAAVGLARLSTDGHWLEINQKICAITGYTHDELQQKTFYDLLYAEDVPEVVENIGRLLESKLQSCKAERRMIRKDFSLVWVQMTHTVVNDEAGKPSYLVSTLEDINERKQHESKPLTELAEAQRRVQALREENKRMEEFLGLASHELRTPLTTIKANIQLALRRLKGAFLPAGTGDAPTKVNAAEDMLVRAERQVGVLNHLVSDMIDISRIQSGRLQLQMREEPCDLVALVRQAAQEQEKNQPKRSIIVDVPEQGSIHVLADPDRISQVIGNYLSNALKYSATDTPVEIMLTADARQARVAVRDHGQGLSAEDQQRVWECFYQSPKSKVLSGSGVGLGLGLYIGRILVEGYRGEVGVESELEKGSTFWFTLPIAQAKNNHEGSQK